MEDAMAVVDQRLHLHRWLVCLALSSTACKPMNQQTTLPVFSDAVRRELGARSGALLIFDPRSCTLSAETTQLLNAVAKRRPLAVRGVMTLIPEDSAAMQQMQDLLGLRSTSRSVDLPMTLEVRGTRAGRQQSSVCSDDPL